MHKFLFLCLSITAISYLYAQSDPGDDEEIQALKSWIASKRQVTVRELGGALSLSGDVRVEYISYNEIKNGFKNAGYHSPNPLVANNQYDIEFNFLLDYRTNFNWATVKVEFDNNMGLIGGTFNRLALERAFFGFRILEGKDYTFDGELGRRRLDYTFDSRIQFGSFMDGALAKFNLSLEKFGDLYFYGGPFVVNETRDHYAVVFEFGILNIYNSGIYSKFSFIDWNTKHYETKILREIFQFVNTQLIVGYKFVPKSMQKVVIFYSALLVNFAARRHLILRNELQNFGTYIGCSIGELRKKGDFSFDTNYQYVQYQAVPDFDSNGIGKGNADGIGLYTLRLDGTGGPTTRFTAVGKAGFQGWQAQLLYLVTDTITISQSFKISHSLPLSKSNTSSAATNSNSSTPGRHTREALLMVQSMRRITVPTVQCCLF